MHLAAKGLTVRLLGRPALDGVSLDLPPGARAQVLLLDAPLAGLDPLTAHGVAELVLRAARGRTLVVAAPEPPPQLRLPRWIWMWRGRVTYDGPPAPAPVMAEEISA